jgi:hypothetical protein
MSNTDNPEPAAPSKDRIVAECLATPPAEWSPNLMAVFIDRLEYALFEERKGKLVAVGEQLDALMHHAFASAPDTVRAAILDDKGDQAIRMAFLLGNLSFAHQFASTTAHRRPDDAFFAAFDEPTTKKIAAYMLKGDSTRTEIAAATELEKKVVSSKMCELTGLGIVDFRRRFGAGDDQDVVEYFLTPAAKHMSASAT